MLVTLAGAMGAAELGPTLAEMIREGKVHAVGCTGANLEEDLFDLVANRHYGRLALQVRGGRLLQALPAIPRAERRG